MHRHASPLRKWTVSPIDFLPFLPILSSAGAQAGAAVDTPKTKMAAGRPPRPPEPVREPPLGGAHVGSYRDLQVRPQPPTLLPRHGRAGRRRQR